MRPAWEELESKGFVMVPGFLPPELREKLLQDFDTGAAPESFPFGFKPIGRRALAAVAPLLRPVLDSVAERTTLKVDSVNFLTLSHYVTTRLAKRTSYLHQDFDLDYRLSGDHLNYLNFWIALRKPRRDRSNVSLIPFDALRERAPEAYLRARGEGGLRWIPESGRTALIGNRGEVIEGEESPLLSLSFDAEELVVTPFTEPGDLLLMRGDLVHRTQDGETERVAASIRATFSGKTLRRVTHVKPEDPAASILQMLGDCCDHWGRDEVSVKELLDYARGQR